MQYEVSQSPLEPIDRDAFIYRLQAHYDGLGVLIKERRFHKPLLVYDREVRESGILDTIVHGFDVAGIEYLLFAEINDEVLFKDIDEGYRVCLLNKCDSVLCVGGKAAVDAGKGINMLRFNGGTMYKYTNPKARRNTGSGLFCVCRFNGDDMTRILSLQVMDNAREHLYTVECYCNYDVQPLDDPFSGFVEPHAD